MALRVLVCTWEEEEQVVIQWLKLNKVLDPVDGNHDTEALRENA